METLILPWMLSCSLRRWCLTSLALAFLVVRDVRVKGSHVLPNCRLVLHTKIKYTLGHILVFIFDSFFQSAFPDIFRSLERGIDRRSYIRGGCVIFEKKNPKFQLPRTSATENSRFRMYTLALLSLLMD